MALSGEPLSIGRSGTERGGDPPGGQRSILGFLGKRVDFAERCTSSSD